MKEIDFLRCMRQPNQMDFQGQLQSIETAVNKTPEINLEKRTGQLWISDLVYMKGDGFSCEYYRGITSVCIAPKLLVGLTFRVLSNVREKYAHENQASFWFRGLLYYLNLCWADFSIRQRFLIQNIIHRDLWLISSPDTTCLIELKYRADLGDHIFWAPDRGI